MLPSDLVAPKTAAGLLGVHVSTVLRWRRKGKLKGWLVAGSRVRFSRADVLALVVPMECGREPARPARSRVAGQRAAARVLDRAGI